MIVAVKELKATSGTDKFFLRMNSLTVHSVPERVSKKINSSEVWYIFLATKLYDNSKKCFLKIFALHPSPLDTCIFWKKHPREKCQKVDPNYFSILDGVYFLHFFPKTTLNASKWQFLYKISTFSPFWSFRGKITVLRHLEGFLEKSEESRPHLKLKNNWGLLSDIFL